jgi:hypothetical protein
VGLDVGRWCIADVSMLEDGFERLLAGKDDVKVLVKVRALRPRYARDGERTGHALLLPDYC